MKDTSAKAALEALIPKTQFPEFEALWPEIQVARARKLTMRAIWQELHKNGLDVSYATFTRFCKKVDQEGSVAKVKHEMPTPQLTKTTAAAPTAAADKSDEEENLVDTFTKNQSTSGSALDAARKTVASTDYAQIARDQVRNSKKNT